MNYIILKYLEIILSWPVIIGILIFLFLIKYKSVLNDLINRISKAQVGRSSVTLTPLQQSKTTKENSVKKPSEDLKKLLNEKIPEKEKLKQIIKNNPESAVKMIRDLTKQCTDLINQNVLLNNWVTFEGTYNMIFRTQIELLKHLREKGTEGDNYINLSKYYLNFQELSKSNITQENFLGFLKNSGFIEINYKDNNTIVNITKFGIDFLDYIMNVYDTHYKNRIF